MLNKIKKKKYYKITFNLASPLALGSGENDNTDKDLIRDSVGNPFIPASSIAGVVRDYFISKNTYSNNQIKKYFGDVNPANDKIQQEHSESNIIFYDAVITSDKSKLYITVRDSVALDEFRTAIPGAKFDMEVLEPGVTFTTYIEQSFFKDYDDDFGIEVVKAFLNGTLVFGGKGMRGYGSIDTVCAYEKEFILPNDIDNWLDFNIFESSDWKSCNVKSDGKEEKLIKIHLELHGGISIRKYTTRVSTDEKTEPDMEQLVLNNKIPVIPGSSWAGVIEHRMREFGINTDNKDSIFGFAKGEGRDAKAKSKVFFAESYLKGGVFKTLSRNAIDRFTSGTVNGALFTERTYYGGNTELVIGWKRREAIPELEARALAAALTDLHFGLLAVGGETSIGRGIFIIKKIDEKEIPEDKAENSEYIYNLILSRIQEVFRNDC